MLCYSSTACGIQFEIYSFWCNIKCTEVFYECKTFQGLLMWCRQRKIDREKRSKKETICLGGSSAESSQTAMTFFSPSLRLPPALLLSQVPKSLDYWSKFRRRHTHIFTQHDSNMWSGRNPYDGSAQGQFELLLWALKEILMQWCNKHLFELFQ